MANEKDIDNDKTAILIHVPTETSGVLQEEADENHRSRKAQVEFIIDQYIQGKYIVCQDNQKK